ncbi:MAG: LemA family protein [Gammaproteobacteria bacterium]|nr:LemA family protein [Gammaproteobacteria bacterium]
MIEWLVIVLLAATLVYAIVIYNRLVRDRQMTRAGWSDIGVQLKRRHDLIPKLIDAVRQYSAFEKATLEHVTALRSRARRASAAISMKPGCPTLSRSTSRTSGPRNRTAP